MGHSSREINGDVKAMVNKMLWAGVTVLISGVGLFGGYVLTDIRGGISKNELALSMLRNEHDEVRIGQTRGVERLELWIKISEALRVRVDALEKDIARMDKLYGIYYGNNPDDTGMQMIPPKKGNYQ